MTERQKYLFDLQGYVLVEDVLSADDCALAIEKLTAHMKPLPKAPKTWFSVDKVLDLGAPFIGLIDHPKLVAVLQNIIGPVLRLESHYSFVRMKDCPPLEMHGGGGRKGRVNFRYEVHNQRIFTGLSVVSLALQDIGEADGGFACIPGSHRAEFPIPEADRKELLSFGGPLVRTIATPKGSAVIFTETLTHGAASWQREYPRYGLFYKYNDRAAIYHDQSRQRPSQAAFDLMSVEQRCYFNHAWEAFGPNGRHNNNVPDFGGSADTANPQNG